MTTIMLSPTSRGSLRSPQALKVKSVWPLKTPLPPPLRPVIKQREGGNLVIVSPSSKFSADVRMFPFSIPLHAKRQS